MCTYIKLYVGIWKHTEVQRGIWRYMAVYGSMWSCMEVYGGMWGAPGAAGATGGDLMPSELYHQRGSSDFWSRFLIPPL